MRHQVVLFIAFSAMIGCTWSGGETCAKDDACFADEQCIQGRCVQVLAVKPTAAPPGPIPQELLDKVGAFNGYKLVLDEREHPLIVFSPLGGEALWAVRWDGVQWAAVQVRGAEARGDFDASAITQPAARDRVWMCQSNAAGELWFAELRGEEVRQELVTSGVDAQRPSVCAIYPGPRAQPMIIYFEGDVVGWVNNRATTRLKIALRDERGWQTQELSDGWHGYPAAALSTTTTTTIYVGQLEDAGRAVEQTRTATMLGELLTSATPPPLEAIIGRPASPDAVASTVSGEHLLAHTRNPGRASFALYLSRRVGDLWRTSLLMRGDAAGDNVADVSIHPHPDASEDATVLFALSNVTGTKQTVHRATILGERLTVAPAQVEGVEEALTGISAAMDSAGRVHAIYTTAADAPLSYGVLR